tara:strand:+ start:252 stop:584 length:333 start_codon:yes stop_codon:yes gene_type:complete
MVKIKNSVPTPLKPLNHMRVADRCDEKTFNELTENLTERVSHKNLEGLNIDNCSNELVKSFLKEYVEVELVKENHNELISHLVFNHGSNGTDEGKELYKVINCLNVLVVN